jgi:hypothetical protein
VGLQCCCQCNRILVQRSVERRRSGVSQHHLSRKGCTRDAAAAVRCPSGSIPFETRLEAALHPLLVPEFGHYFRVPPQLPRSSRATSRVSSWLEPEAPLIECGALLAGVIPDGRGPSQIGPKLRANFFLRSTPRLRAASSKSRVRDDVSDGTPIVTKVTSAQIARAAAIRNLAPGTAPGPDGLHVEHLKITQKAQNVEIGAKVTEELARFATSFGAARPSPQKNRFVHFCFLWK